MKFIVLLLSLFTSIVGATELESKVENVTIKTIHTNQDSTLKEGKSSLSTVEQKIARDYFETIDLTKNEWNNLQANKKLYFINQHIYQEISIVVPPLYEMLLFSGDGNEYKSKKLLDKTIEKQCDRYVRHQSDFNVDINEYIKVVNLTSNIIKATLKNSKLITIEFKCNLVKK